MGEFTPTTGHPDNRHEFCQVDETDEIIIGGTATHIFQISDFNYQTEGKMPGWFEITYRQSVGGTVVVYGYANNQHPSEFEVSYDSTLNKTTIKVNISEEVSKTFDAHRVTYAQLKLFIADSSGNLSNIIYGEKNIIRVIDPLDNGLSQGE